MILIRLLQIALAAVGITLVVAPVVYFLGVILHEQTGVGFEHDPLVPPIQLIEVGFLYGTPMLLIAIGLGFFIRRRKAKL